MTKNDFRESCRQKEGIIFSTRSPYHHSPFGGYILDGACLKTAPESYRYFSPPAVRSCSSRAQICSAFTDGIPQWIHASTPHPQPTLISRSTTRSCSGCIYQKKTAFLVVIHRDDCEVLCYPERNRRPLSYAPFYANGVWSTASLHQIQSLVRQPPSPILPRRDRVSRDFGDFTLHVAYRRIRGDTVIRLTLKPSSGK